MPLAIPAQPDLDDLTKYKHRVYVEAKKMAKRHGLCGVVDKTLESLDIEPYVPQVRKVDVEVTMKGIVSVSVDVNQLAGMTPAEENAYLAGLVEGNPAKGLTVKVKDAKYGEDLSTSTLPDGYIARFTSSEGRVRHILRAEVQQAPGHERLHDYLLCHSSRTPWYLHVSDLVDESPRDEGRICAHCTKKMEKL